MAIGGSVRELGRFLEACEHGDRRVSSVELSDGAGPVAATVKLSVASVMDGADPPALEAPRIGPDGSIRFGFAAAPRLAPVADHQVDVECLDASLAEDGSLTATLRVTPLDGSDSPAQSSATAFGSESEPLDSEPEVPPFKDPDRLAEIYASCDTFAEMAEIIDMDVTAETVRRYMIDYDIHEPNTYRTDADEAAGEPTTPSATNGDSAEPIVLSDGIGLPDDVTIDTLIDTVKRSNTFYEVTREVNVDREDAREMLEQLNLLDLVMGRLATEQERDLSREEIVDRLREAPGTE